MRNHHPLFLQPVHDVNNGFLVSACLEFEAELLWKYHSLLPQPSRQAAIAQMIMQ
jgi:hypothetical protein